MVTLPYNTYHITNVSIFFMYEIYYHSFYQITYIKIRMICLTLTHTNLAILVKKTENISSLAMILDVWKIPNKIT